MSKQTRARLVATRDIVLAAVLLVGILLITYGTFGSNRLVFYAGLLIVLGGVITGLIRVVVHGGNSR